MRTRLFLVLLLALTFFNACKKSTTDEELSFTKLTVEQQKQKMEDNGIELINTVQNIENTDAYKAVMHLNELMNNSIPVAPTTQRLKQMVAFESKSLIQKAAIEPDNRGKWVWNFTTKEFEKKETYTTQKMMFLFPATETSTTNDAEFTLDWTDSNTLVPGGGKEYLPAKITSVLKVKGNTAIDASFVGAYNSEGLPTTITEKLTVDKFQFNTNGTNNGKLITSDLGFSYDGKKLLGYDFKSEGTFNKTAFENIEDGPGDIISNANLTLYAMNIGCVGKVSNIKEIQDAGNAFDGVKRGSAEEKAAAEKMAQVVNKNVKIFGYFVDENKKFADVECFVDLRTEKMYTGYDPKTGQPIYQDVIYYSTDFRFIMSDGSKLKAEEYLQKGFDNLINKLKELQDKYGVH